MADAIQPFSGWSANNTIAVTISSGGIGPIADAGWQTSLRIANVGSAEAFVAIGTTALPTAAAGGTANLLNDGSLSIPPGTVEVLTVGQGPIWVAAICAGTGTTTLRIARGTGN